MFATDIVCPTSKLRHERFATPALALLALGLTYAAASPALGATPDSAKLEWDTKLNHFQIDSDKFVGQRFSFECPERPEGLNLPPIHGTNIYPSGTPLCPAAVHAGALGPAGGRINVQVNPGLNHYAGRDQRGLRSSPFGRTARSFVFLGEPFADSLTPIQRQHAPRLKWKTKFTATGLANRKLVGQRFVFHCPEAPAKLAGRRVYGTDTYAFNGLVCLSAVHAGRLTKEGGFVVVQMIEAKAPLEGSLRHGIESKSGRAGDRQIVFLRLPSELATLNAD